MNNLQLVDLLRRSNEGEKCLNEARNAFQTKYNRSNFALSNKHHYFYENGVIYEGEMTISVRNTKVIRKFLNNFGDLIAFVGIDFDSFTADEGKDIVAQIDNKCFASLKRICFVECKRNVLDELKNSFDNVTSMTFSTNIFEPSSFSHKMDKFFPHLKDLQVRITSSTDWMFIIGKFPRLTSLTVDFQRSNASDAVAESISGFFKENSQINYLSFWYSSLKVLKGICHHLSEHKILYIRNLFEDYLNYGHEVQLNCVYKLDIHFDSPSEVPENVVFDQLEELNLYIHMQNNSTKWFDFISNKMNKNLTKLVLGIGVMQSSEFLSIPDTFPQLQDVNIRGRSNVTANDIGNYYCVT